MPIPNAPITTDFYSDTSQKTSPKDPATSGNLPVNYINETTTLESKLKQMESISQSFQSSIMGKGLLFENINSTYWNKNFPYVLQILIASKNDSVSDTSKNPSANISGVNTSEQNAAKGTQNNAALQVSYSPFASFRLPINPQDITISTQFSIKPTFTSRGFTEEHSGVRAKQIFINGTTGINLNRQSAPYKGGPNVSSFGTIFASSIDSFGQLTSLVSNPTANPLAQTTTTQKDNTTNNDIKLTGFYQYHILRMVLEHYAELKSSAKDGAKYRLGLSIPKDGITYLVTPMNFTTKRSVFSPMEYNYSLQMLAWGSTNNLVKDSPTQRIVNNSQAGQISTFQNLLNTLTQARNTVNQFKSLVTAVQSDINTNIIGPLNQIVLLAKNVLSIPATLADIPASLATSFNTSVIANFNSLKTQLPDTDITRQLSQAVSDIKSTTPVAKPLGFSNQGNNVSQYSDLSSYGSGAATAANNYLKQLISPESGIANYINVADLNPSPDQQAAYDSAVNASYSTTANDINKLISNINDTVKKLTPTVTSLNPTEPEWNLLYDLQDAVANLTASLATNVFNNSQQEVTNQTSTPGLSLTALDYWTAATTTNNIGFNTPQAKIQVPFPFGSSLEQLAQTYLGDPSRWLEIAALNGLEYPYIDENGTYISLLSNPTVSNQIFISDITNLYVGQKVYLSSNTQLAIIITIDAIYQISSNQYLLYIDANGADITQYTVEDSAQIKAFAPNTVNSLMKIFIPTTQVPNFDDIGTKILPFIKENIDIVKFSQIDFLLDDKYDLAIASDGFANYAFGQTNLIQAAKLKMITTPGSLLLHPEYGASPNIGDSVAEVSVGDIMNSISNSFKADPRFNSPSQITVVQQASSLAIQVDAVVAHDNEILPISFPLSGV